MLPYAHLLKHDADLLHEYITANPGRYRHFECDVHVGTGRDPGPGYLPVMRDMAIRLSQRRIDCVGFRPDRIDIIEVTQRADLKALGQLFAYPTLYLQTFKPTLTVFPVLVTRSFGTDVDSVWIDSRIDTYIFPET